MRGRWGNVEVGDGGRGVGGSHGAGHELPLERRGCYGNLNVIR